MLEFKEKTRPVFGIFLLIIPAYLMGLWFYVSIKTSGLDFTSTLKLYQDYLPSFLHQRYAITLFSIPFCILAIILNVNESAEKTKPVSITIIIVAGILIFMNL